VNALRLALPLVWFLSVCGPMGLLGAAEGPDPEDEVRPTLSGTVRMPDGSPARKAVVESPDTQDGPPIVTHTDDAGRFHVRGVFGNMARFHARSSDGALHATKLIASDAVRTLSANAIELTLEPGVDQDVVVRADGQPVDGAQVVATGDTFRALGITASDGKLRLQLPARDRVRTLVAWHPERGVRGAANFESGLPLGKIELSLLPPGPPLRIRVLDPDDRPVPGVKLGVNVLVEGSDWASASLVEPARIRTGQDGAATIPWAPRDALKYVDVRIIDSDWKLDETDIESIAERFVLVHVRRKVPVPGRLAMPAGASAEGILVTGFGFGPANHGDAPHTRARADGSFTLRVASAHGYVLGVVDREWAGDLWSGLILTKDDAAPPDITVPLRRATPVLVRVTRGPKHTPVAEAWVEVSHRGTVNWVDPLGKPRSGSGGIRYWLTTDEHGLARAGMASGEGQVRLSSRAWNEERAIDVPADKPLEVAFHRAWEGERHVTGRLLSDGKPFTPSTTLVALAWIPHGLRGVIPTEVKPTVKPDGTFEVVFDAEAAILFFNDLSKQRSGFINLGLEASADVTMLAMATFSGTLIDQDGQPVAGEPLNLQLQDGGRTPVATELTDPAGRFRFTAVPSDVPLTLRVGDVESRIEFFVLDPDRKFAPSAVRENELVKCRRLGAPKP
jgi:hypothetical protein